MATSYSFSLWDVRGDEYSLTVNDLPDSQVFYRGYFETSRFFTGAVVIHGWDADAFSVLRIVDLITGQVLAGRTLAAGEFLMPTNDADTLLHIGQISGQTISVRTFDYGLSANDASLAIQVGNTLTGTLPDGFSNGDTLNYWQAQYVPPTSTSAYGYMLFQQFASTGSQSVDHVLLRIVDGGTAEQIALPTSDIQWAGNAFIHQGELWLNTFTVSQPDGYYRLVGTTWTSVTEEDFWDTRSLATDAESVVRDGSHALDLLTRIPADGHVDLDPESGDIIELPTGGLLVRAEVEFVDSLGYEQWLIFQNGTVSIEKAFSSGSAPLLRSVQTPEGSYAYFQQLDIDLNTLTQASHALTLYRVALADLPGILANAGETLIGMSGVDEVASYSQAQLQLTGIADGFFAIVEGYIPVSRWLAADTGAIVWSVVNENATGTDTNYISRIEANGTVTYATAIPEAVEETIVDDIYGLFVITNYDDAAQHAYHVNIVTGELTEIDTRTFWLIEQGGAVPEGLVPTIDESLPPNIIIGSDDPDTLIGSDGKDSISGGGGNDTISAGLGNDSVDGGEGDDTLDGGEGNDSMLGGAGADVIEAGTGRDTLDGGLGADTLGGGSGNDTYYINDAGDIASETGNDIARGQEALVGAIDNVIASISYVLTNFIENLELQADAGSIAGTGNDLDNILTGNSSANILDGAAGNDSLSGGGGNDTLDGGAGSDTAIFGGNRSTYSFSLGSDGTLTVSGADGTDTLSGIELLRFDDADYGLSQAIPAQLETVRHYAKVQAYFLGLLNREATTEEANTFTAILQTNQSRVWWNADISAMLGTDSLMGYLMAQTEYATLTANSHSSIVDTIYNRLTGETASQELVDHYVARLAAGPLLVQGVANKMLGELYLSPKGDGTLGTVAGFADNRGFLDGEAYMGYLNMLDAIDGIGIANLDANGNLTAVGVA
jgi:Ca2+-binding RTX toxin-like protein